MLHKALHDAVRWGHLAANPAALATPPRPAHSRDEGLDARAAVRRFLEHAATHRPSPHRLLISTTGMHRAARPSGSCGTTSIFNADGSPSSAVSQSFDTIASSSPNRAAGDDRSRSTRDGRRVERIDTVNGECLAAGLIGRMPASCSPARRRSRLGPAPADAKLPKIRLHDLRHSYATAALSAGIAAKVVSERLGHASVAITLDTYSHVHPALQEEAAHTVASLILGSDRLGAHDEALEGWSMCRRSGGRSGVPLIPEI